MDVMANQERGQSGSGVGSNVADDVKLRLPEGDPFDREKQQKDQNAQGQLAYPHELTNIVDSLGDVFVAVLSIKKTFERAGNNPALEKDQHKSIEKINKKLDTVNQIIANLTSDIDNLQLSK